MSQQQPDKRITVNSETRVRMPSSAGDLRRIMESGAFPDNASVNVVITKGQMDAEYIDLVFKWSREA